VEGSNSVCYPPDSEVCPAHGLKLSVPEFIPIEGEQTGCELRKPGEVRMRLK